MHIKAEGMTQFDIFHVLVENSVNSKLCFFLALLKPAKIWYLSKNAHVWAAQKTSSSELKTIFDSSLERSWYELFRIIKANGPKNQPPFVIKSHGRISQDCWLSYYLFSGFGVVESHMANEVSFMPECTLAFGTLMGFLLKSKKKLD